MQPPNPQSLIHHFASLEDPRVSGRSQHKLIDILVIAICGVICGADDWVSIAGFGEAKEDWFREFLELPNGIPSHDTFGRTFSLLSPKTFQESFTSWIHSLMGVFEGLVAIDGVLSASLHDGAELCGYPQSLISTVEDREWVKKFHHRRRRHWTKCGASLPTGGLREATDSRSRRRCGRRPWRRPGNWG